jgi:hypothetical protein
MFNIEPFQDRLTIVSSSAIAQVRIEFSVYELKTPSRLLL